MTRKSKKESVNSTRACPLERVKLVRTFRLRCGEDKSDDIYRTPGKCFVERLLSIASKVLASSALEEPSKTNIFSIPFRFATILSFSFVSKCPRIFSLDPSVGKGA